MRPAGSVLALFVVSIAGVQAQTVPDCFGTSAAQPIAAMTGTSTINASPTALTFSYIIGSGSLPADQMVNITPLGIRFTETASTSSGGNWLKVCPVIGAAPGPLSVGILNPSSLPAGIYNGSISVASDQAENKFVTITVTLLILPAITISSIAPSSVTAGGGNDITLTVTGTNFQNTSKVCWNNTSLVTAYHDSMLLTATVPASLIAQAGVAKIFVGDPLCAGDNVRLSNVLMFTIDLPPPLRIVSLSPATVACNLPFTLTVNGTGFLPESIVRLNRTPLPTTVDSDTQLRATVTADLVAKAGSAEIVVINPGNVASNTVSLQIVSCAVIDSLDPVAAIVGGPTFNLIVNGCGFDVESLILWNGLPLLPERSSLSPTKLTVEVPASLIATAGCASITVTPGKPMSKPVSFCAIAPPSFFGPILHGSTGPGDQPTFDFGIDTSYPLKIDVTATLLFEPNAIAPVNDDPMIHLTAAAAKVTATDPPPGAIRQITFMIMPGEMTVPIMVQTGTVAGIITMKVLAQVAGSNPYMGTVVIPIPRSAPVIYHSNLTFTPTGFEVAITGFSPERAMQKAVFQFNAPSGSKNKFPDITLDVADIFAAYYQDASSKPFGSMFTYKQAFTLEGAAAAIGSVTVSLTNSRGTSAPSTTN